MKFNKITHFSDEEGIFNEEDFRESVFVDLLKHIATDYNKILFCFDKYSENKDEIHELYYFIQGEAVHMETLSEDVSIYELDDITVALLTMGDGGLGVAVKDSDVEQLKNFL